MSDVVNLNSVFKVKNPTTGSWELVPAVKGTSVYTLEAKETSRTVGSKDQTGYILKVFDEKKQLIDPSYEYDSFIVWNGVDGDGTVNTVDYISHDSGSLNVTLNAVRYVELALESAEQSLARANINAFKDVPVTSLQNGYIVKYSYDSTVASGLWTAASLEVSEIANAVPSARKVNNYPLSADINLNPTDVGAVHSALTINGVSISNATTTSASISLTPSNINALHSAFKINNVSVVNPTTAQAKISLFPENIGAVHSALKINGYSINDATTSLASITTRILTSNITVSSSAWTSSGVPSAIASAGFLYKQNVTINGVTTDMVPQVVFSIEDVISGNFAPIVESINGGITLYAESVPESNTKLETVICFK